MVGWIKVSLCAVSGDEGWIIAREVVGREDGMKCIGGYGEDFLWMGQSMVLKLSVFTCHWWPHLT
jgi:hypothetical protein